MKKNRSFEITRERLQDHINEILQLGEKWNLQPEELAIVLGFAYDFLSEETGLEIKAQFGVHSPNEIN